MGLLRLLRILKEQCCVALTILQYIMPSKFSAPMLGGRKKKWVKEIVSAVITGKYESNKHFIFSFFSG